MHRPPSVSEKQDQALRDLKGLSRERDLLHSLFEGLFARGTRHFSAAEPDASDPIEVWGRRIGRALGAVAFVALCVYLFFTYVR